MRDRSYRGGSKVPGTFFLLNVDKITYRHYLLYDKGTLITMFLQYITNYSTLLTINLYYAYDTKLRNTSRKLTTIHLELLAHKIKNKCLII